MHLAKETHDKHIYDIIIDIDIYRSTQIHTYIYMYKHSEAPIGWLPVATRANVMSHMNDLHSA